MTVGTQENFDDLMHSLHGTDNPYFAKMGGDCWSCHYANANGEQMQLWDAVKHSVLRGITRMSSDTMNGEFSWNQDKVQTADEAFQFFWLIHMPGDLNRLSRELTGLKPDPENDGVYDSWMLTINGDVENPTTMSINDWIAAIGLDTTVMAQQCLINPIGGPYVSNREITGLSVQKMIEYCKPVEGANAAVAMAFSDWVEQEPHDSYVPFERSLKGIRENGMYVVLEIGGETIPYGLGYPTQLYYPDCAGTCIKEVSQITVVSREKTDNGELNAEFATYTNAAIANLAEGQILPVNEPHVFEGYAHQLAGNIVSIELSFDQGATWLNFPIENEDNSRWIWWNYEWTPTEPGAYTIALRATGIDGQVTRLPIEIMFNVK